MYLCVKCNNFHKTKQLMKNCDHKKIEIVVEVPINLEELISSFAENQEVVKGYNAEKLKSLCENYEIDYTNVSNAKTDLLAYAVELEATNKAKYEAIVLNLDVANDEDILFVAEILEITIV